ncbi:MAG TPA: CAP domain-containing protein [Candidatus Eremiobacteraceae bacterium]
MLRRTVVAFCAAVLAAGLLLFPQAARASSIPTISEGAQVLVAVEPLLETMQIRYHLAAGRLSIGDQAYIGPMVIDNGLYFADPQAIAAFLNLQISYPNGVMTFAPPAPRAGVVAEVPGTGALDALRIRLLALLNAHRTATGLPSLAIDTVAQSAAQYQAKDMESAGIMRHTDSSGRSPIQRFQSIGGLASRYGENVAYFGLDINDLENEWQAVGKLDAMMMAEQAPDDGHREAILSPEYRKIGIGVAIGTNGLYLAEDFVAR